MAEKNPTMAIWLGKQYLDQKDQHDVQVTSDDDTIRAMREYFESKKRNDDK